MLYYHIGLFMPRVREATAARNLGGGYSFGNDFYQVWVTSRECVRSRRDPYSDEMTRDIQTGMFGRPLDLRIPSDFVDRRVFPYPAFTLLLFWPVAELPFVIIRIAVLALLTAMTVAAVLLWLQALAWQPSRSWLAVLVILTLCSYPVLEGLYAGQLGLLVAFLLASAILALKFNRLLPAGVLIAFTTIKPQVTVLVIFYLLLWSLHDWRTRRRFLAGFLSAMILLVGASLAVWPHWIQSWVHTVFAYHRYTRPALVMEVIAAPLGPRAAGPATSMMIAALMIGAAVLGWRNRTVTTDSAAFWFTLAILLSVTTVAVLPGQAVYDHIILLPGILLLARSWREFSSSPLRKALLSLGVAMLLWPWFASLCLIVVRPLMPDPQLYSNAMLALPLRTAASFPFVVLGLLALAYRTTVANRVRQLSAPR